MIRLLDGPAARAYPVQRAPVYLRAVVAEDGRKDVLDLPEDAPTAQERVYVYQRVTHARFVHVNGIHVNGVFATGDYKFMPDVDGEALRETREWRRWETAGGDA